MLKKGIKVKLEMNTKTDQLINRLQGKQSGFSLVELMVVVAIIGILAAIAMPSYQGYVQRSRAAEATSTLADARVRMEQYFQDNRTYVGGPCPAAGKSFTFACVITATTYDITATGKSAENMGNFEFTIDEANARTSKYAGTTAACWQTSKGSAC